MSTWYTRALVTGATGFVGSRLVDRLVQDKVAVHALVLPGQVPAGGGSSVQWHEGDITEQGFVRQTVRASQPDIIFHLAAYGTFRGEEDVERMLAVNVHGTRHMLLAAQGDGCQAFVQAGSAKEYAPSKEPAPETQALQPWDAYAATKAAAHFFGRLAARDGLPVRVLRLSPVYGPGDAPKRFVLTAIRAALENKPFTISVGPARRNFTYIDDVVDAFLRAADKQQIAYDEYNIGAAQARSFDEVLAAIEKTTGKTLQKIVTQGEAGSYDSWVVDTSKAAEKLGWQANISLQEGISRTVEWYRQTL